MSITNIDLSYFALHSIEENQKCLVIDSSEENFSDNPSKIFSEVNFLFFNKNQHFVNNIVEGSVPSNIRFLDIKNFKNFFTKNSLDLIIIYNWSELETNKKILFEIFQEIQKILKQNGCLLIPIKKQKFFSNKSEIFLKKFNFNISKNWVLPSLYNPLYFGKLNDLQPMVWFFKNLDNFIPSFKKMSLKKNVFLKSVRILNQKFLPFFTIFLTPSFIISCSQNELVSYESHLLQKTKLKSSILVNRPFKLMYILFDEVGKPKQTVSIEKKLLSIDGNQNFFRELDDISVHRDWIEGRIIDPLKNEEILLAISWIINFQKNNQKNLYHDDEINKEINSIRETILAIPELEKYSLQKWINEYENFLKNNAIYKTAVHGDLSHKNMILKSNMKDIEVIDWYFFKKIGNPMDDVSNFLFRLLIKSKTETKINAFKSKLEGKSPLFNKLRNEAEKLFSDHFNFDFDLLFAIKFYFLKSIYTKILNKDDFSLDLEYVSILSKIPTKTRNK